MGSLSLCWKMFLHFSLCFWSDVFCWKQNSGLTGVLSLHLHYGCHCLVPVTSGKERLRIMAHCSVTCPSALSSGFQCSVAGGSWRGASVFICALQPGDLPQRACSLTLLQGIWSSSASVTAPWPWGGAPAQPPVCMNTFEPRNPEEGKYFAPFETDVCVLWAESPHWHPKESALNWPTVGIGLCTMLLSQSPYPPRWWKGLLLKPVCTSSQGEACKGGVSLPVLW